MVHVFGTFHQPGPKSDNARAELKGTGHTAKFQQAFYLQTFTQPNFPLPYLKPLPYNNLTTKPYKPYKTLPPIRTLNSFLNSSNSLFVPFGVKPCLLLLLLYINFVALKVVHLLSSKAVNQFPTAVEVWFILLQNVGINWAFRGL